MLATFLEGPLRGPLPVRLVGMPGGTSIGHGLLMARIPAHNTKYDDQGCFRLDGCAHRMRNDKKFLIKRPRNLTSFTLSLAPVVRGGPEPNFRSHCDSC